MSENKFRYKMRMHMLNDLDKVMEDGRDHTEDAKRVYKNFCIEQKRKRKRVFSAVGKRASLIACMVVAIFVTSMFFSDVPSVKAFTSDFKNVFISMMNHVSKDEAGDLVAEYTNLEDVAMAYDGLPFLIGYVPEGYVLNRVQVKDESKSGARLYCFEYFNTKETPIGHLSITAYEITDRDHLMAGAYNALSTTYYTDRICGNDVTFILGPPNTAVYNFRYMYEISITSQLNEKEVVKIIRNIR